MRTTSTRNGAFTLIELLIVVAIIAILAAIAVPNFLEAQTRSKVSRAKADMRTAATAIEMYYVDNNRYPTGWGINVGGNADMHSLFLLSTPISYITSGDMQDPFFPVKDDEPMNTTIQYDPMTPDGRMDSAYNRSLNHTSGDDYFPWWILISVGPDKEHEFTYAPGDGTGLQARLWNADNDLEAFLDVFYDPTNGTVSRGNIYRAGGGQMNAAGRFIEGHQ